MKTKTRYAIGIVIALLLTGCNDPKIDATNKDTIDSSAKIVRDALPEGKRPEFDKAIKLVAFMNVTKTDYVQAIAHDDPSIITAKISASIDGKTGDEILAEAKEIESQHKH